MQGLDSLGPVWDLSIAQPPGLQAICSAVWGLNKNVFHCLKMLSALKLYSRHLVIRYNEWLATACTKFLSEFQYGYNNFTTDTTNRSNLGDDSSWNSSISDTHHHSFEEEEIFSKKLFNEREFPFIFANYSSFLSHLFPSNNISDSTSNETFNLMSSVCTNLTMSGKN